MNKNRLNLFNPDYSVVGKDFSEYQSVDETLESASESFPTKVIYLPPPEKKVLFLDHIFCIRRAFPRLGCYGPVSIFNKFGRVVAKGRMLDINEISCGIELSLVDVRVGDELFLNLPVLDPFVYRQVKIVLKRVCETKFTTQVGVEFVDTTRNFRVTLADFLHKKRAEENGFTDYNII